jgi:predicted Na+-dependent transporter
MTLLDDQNDYSVYIIKITPGIFGAANLSILSQSDEHEEEKNVIMIGITEPRRFVDKFFDVYVWIFGVMISTLMGCLLELETIKKLVKIPVPVLIGLGTQYICMPLLAFAFVSIFKLLPAEALALFIYGCCPGGAASNNW